MALNSLVHYEQLRSRCDSISSLFLFHQRENYHLNFRLDIAHCLSKTVIQSNWHKLGTILIGKDVLTKNQ